MIPEVEDFLAELRGFIRHHQDAGVFMPINGDSLLEMLLSVVDGLAFARLINADFGYSSRISGDDVAAITRLLVSGLLVSPLHQSRLYYDAVAQDYDDLYTDGISQAENALVVRELRQMCAGKRVLDLGCGSGLGYELLLEACGSAFEYVGVDISSQMVEAARKRWPAVENAAFEVMDAADLSYFPADSFDCVISLFGSFSHVVERDQAVSELQRVLRAGGQMLLMLYSRFSLRNTWLNLRRLRLTHYDSMHPYEIRKTSGSIFADAWFYDRRTIRRVFDRFEDLDVRGLNALLELPLFAAPFESERRKAQAMRYLEVESAALRRMPNLCHSLLVTGTKSDPTTT
jgi:ubiquinone/menaquinone biosynthesis C-methylase UbiE